MTIHFYDPAERTGDALAPCRSCGAFPTEEGFGAIHSPSLYAGDPAHRMGPERDDEVEDYLAPFDPTTARAAEAAREAAIYRREEQRFRDYDDGVISDDDR